MIERGALRFEAGGLASLELPSFAATGAADGPHLALIAGIHGCEYSSIAAVTRFMRELDTGELRGRITAVPVVNLSSFHARSPFVVPEDGKNLNRCFPGSYEGTFSDALARAVFDQVIAPADVLVDLHGGDLVEALEPFVLYDESPLEERAKGIAVAFGFPYVVRSAPAEAPISGTTSSAAAAARLGDDCGLLEESAVRLHLDGLTNALRHLEMLPGEPAPPTTVVHHVDRFVWLRSTGGGWWETSVQAGGEASAGSLVGVVRDLYGEVVEEIVAPEDGVALFVTTSAAVAADGLLLGLGTGLMPVA